MKKLLMAVMGTFAICLTGCNGVTQPGWDEDVFQPDRPAQAFAGLSWSGILAVPIGR